MGSIRFARPSNAFLSLATLLVVSCYGARVYVDKNAVDVKEATKNYAIAHEKPSSWTSIPHGPQTLFSYFDPKSHLMVRGSVNQIVAEYNPTPDMDTDHTAQFYIDRTHDNQPEWTAEMMDTAPGDNTSFRLIRRARKDKCVITAFAVKGNTTLLVTLSANGKDIANIDPGLPGFKDFLRHVKMSESDMSTL